MKLLLHWAKWILTDIKLQLMADGWWLRHWLPEFPCKINCFPEPHFFFFAIWSDIHLMSLFPVLTDWICPQYLIDAQKVKTIMLLLASNEQWNKLNKCTLFQILKQHQGRQTWEEWLKECAHHRKGLWEDSACKNEAGEEDSHGHEESSEGQCPCGSCWYSDDYHGHSGIICFASNIWLGIIAAHWFKITFPLVHSSNKILNV